MRTLTSARPSVCLFVCSYLFYFILRMAKKYCQDNEMKWNETRSVINATFVAVVVAVVIVVVDVNIKHVDLFLHPFIFLFNLLLSASTIKVK